MKVEIKNLKNNVYKLNENNNKENENLKAKI